MKSQSVRKSLHKFKDFNIPQSPIIGATAQDFKLPESLNQSKTPIKEGIGINRRNIFACSSLKEQWVSKLKEIKSRLESLSENGSKESVIILSPTKNSKSKNDVKSYTISEIPEVEEINKRSSYELSDSPIFVLGEKNIQLDFKTPISLKGFNVSNN